MYTVAGIAQLPVIHFEHVSARPECRVVIPLTVYVVGVILYGELRMYTIQVQQYKITLIMHCCSVDYHGQ